MKKAIFLGLLLAVSAFAEQRDVTKRNPIKNEKPTAKAGSNMLWYDDIKMKPEDPKCEDIDISTQNPNRLSERVKSRCAKEICVQVIPISNQRLAPNQKINNIEGFCKCARDVFFTQNYMQDRAIDFNDIVTGMTSPDIQITCGGIR